MIGQKLKELRLRASLKQDAIQKKKLDYPPLDTAIKKFYGEGFPTASFRKLIEVD